MISADFLGSQTMPPELLWSIFGFVRVENGEKQMVGAISKALLPYTRANLYHGVKLESWDQLRKLAGTVQADEELGELIIDLEVAMEAEPDPEAHGPEVDCPIHVVGSLLSSLFELERLTSSMSLVTELVLDEDFAEACLPSLEWLKLSGTFDDFSNPWDPSNYRAVDLYESLYFLKLDILRAAESISGPVMKVKKKRDRVTFPSVSILYVMGPLTHRDAPAFVESFVEAGLVKLFDSSPSPNFAPLLKKLSPTVENLTLIGELRDDPSPTILDRNSLLRFKSLKELDIAVPEMVVSSVLDTLKDPLPLHRLSFGYGVDVSVEKLRQLVEGGPERNRLTSLKTLEIDTVDGQRGTRIEDADGPYFGGDWAGPAQPHPDWIPPYWTPNFTYKGAKDLVVACGKVGVSLEGSLEEALEIEAEFMDEIDWITSFEMAFEEDLRDL